MEEKCRGCGHVLFEKELLDDRGHTGYVGDAPKFQSDEAGQYIECPACERKNIVRTSQSTYGLPQLVITGVRKWVYSVLFETKSNPSTPRTTRSTLIPVKSINDPPMDKVKALIRKRCGDDVKEETITIMGKRHDDKGEPGIYDLDE